MTTTAPSATPAPQDDWRSLSAPKEVRFAHTYRLMKEFEDLQDQGMKGTGADPHTLQKQGESLPPPITLGEFADLIQYLCAKTGLNLLDHSNEDMWNRYCSLALPRGDDLTLGELCAAFRDEERAHMRAQFKEFLDAFRRYVSAVQCGDAALVKELGDKPFSISPEHVAAFREILFSEADISVNGTVLKRFESALVQQARKIKHIHSLLQQVLAAGTRQ